MTDIRNSQLFLDDRWIAYAHRVQRVWHEAFYYPEPVIKPDRPWEGHQLVLFGSAVSDIGFDGFRIYYTTFCPPAERYLCVAESDDGVQWRKPTLGIHEWQGSRDNNIVLRAPRNHDSGTLFYDPDAECPYLLYYFMRKDPNVESEALHGSIYVARSRDGIQFEHVVKPVLFNTGDRNNVMLRRVNGKVVLLCRSANMMADPGSRSIWIAESDDGYSFSDPELVLQRDLLDAPLVEYYGMAAFPYGDLYMGLLEYWHQRPDRIEVILSWSDDLRKWHLPPARQPFIGSKFPWNENWSSPSSAGPITMGNQLLFYFGGRSGAHGLAKPRSYGAIGLATVTMDRFCSLTADMREGVVVTNPMKWPGGDLLLNASTTRYLDTHPLAGGGEIKIEILDENRKEIKGYAGKEGAIFHGNMPCREAVAPASITWSNKSLDKLKGRNIRIRFTLRDSHLYSFQASS